MKVAMLFFILLWFVSCFTMDAEEKTMGKSKLKNGDIIELVNRGVGATAPDIIWVYKTNIHGEKFIVGKIVGIGSDYKVDFNQLNDSLLKVILTDTSVFKGIVRLDTINFRNGVKL